MVNRGPVDIQRTPHLPRDTASNRHHPYNRPPQTIGTNDFILSRFTNCLEDNLLDRAQSSLTHQPEF